MYNSRLTPQVGRPAHRPTPHLAKYLGEGTQDSGSADSGNGDVCHFRTRDRHRHQRGKTLIPAILEITQHIAKMKWTASPGHSKMKCNDFLLFKQFSLVITMGKRRGDGIYDKRAFIVEIP